MQSYQFAFPFSNSLVYTLSEKLCQFSQKPIILCLGSDKVIADSLGPLVGQFLLEHKVPAYIYGSLSKPITSSNLPIYYEYIHKTHKDAKILVVDAKIGSLQEFGTIQIKSGGIVPYQNSFYKPIGNLHITGTVLEQNFVQKLLLHQTKLQFIYELAKKIAYTIEQAYTIVY